MLSNVFMKFFHSFITTSCKYCSILYCSAFFYESLKTKVDKKMLNNLIKMLKKPDTVQAKLFTAN